MHVLSICNVANRLLMDTHQICKDLRNFTDEVRFASSSAIGIMTEQEMMVG
jgi:hypothetical protein